METANPLVQHLVEHLAKTKAEHKVLETAYGNAVKGSVRSAEMRKNAKRREMCITAELLHTLTGKHHF